MARAKEAISPGVILLEQASPPDEGTSEEPEEKIEFETKYPVYPARLIEFLNSR